MAKKTTFWQGWLMDNPLTEDPNDFTLKVKAGNMVTTEDIAKALQAEGSEFQLETLIDILNRGDRIIRNKLLAGYSVGTGVFYAQSVIHKYDTNRPTLISYDVIC
ncbi:MAG: hypothetical protein K2P54_04125, partial [Odoribacter sp.]|nr:hypothetical protein [Odoribacter sp.]